MTRSRARRSAVILLRILATLSVVSASGIVSGLLVRGQTLRPAVRIAYVHGGNIWVLDEPSGKRIRVTSDGHDAGPSWTSNGNALLFQRQSRGRLVTLRWQPGRGHPQAGTRRLRQGLWSPDGTAVAFTGNVPGGESATTVWVARQGHLTRSTPPEHGYRWYPLAWSPDSTQLALGRFTVPPGTNPQAAPYGPASLWVASTTTAPPSLRRLPLPHLSPGQPGWPDVVVWSPDDRYLAVGVGPDQACVSCRLDGEPFSVLPVSGGAAIHLGVALYPDEALSWAPNGSYIVLSVPGGRETYVDKHLIRVDPVTGARLRLTLDRRWADVEPAVSPNGKQIAFVRGRSAMAWPHLTAVQLIASRCLILMDADGSHLRRLPAPPGWTDDAPTWSPDGQWLLFVRWRAPHGKRAEATLWAVRATGTGSQRLARLDLPDGFLGGFGYYGTSGSQRFARLSPVGGFHGGFGYFGTIGWQGLFGVAP